MIWLSLNFELHKSELKTPYECAVYKNGLATKIKSEEFRYDKCTTYSVPILLDTDGKTDYKLLLRFPNKTNFVFSSMLPMTILTLLFVVIILVTYTSALKQLIMQKQISEIKTDFINNMTHEFKTTRAWCLNCSSFFWKELLIQYNWTKIIPIKEMLIKRTSILNLVLFIKAKLRGNWLLLKQLTNI